MCAASYGELDSYIELRENNANINGIDSKKYKGYAFGLGVERITNLKYNVKDLRMFSENDVRFLKEFEAAN